MIVSTPRHIPHKSFTGLLKVVAGVAFLCGMAGASAQNVKLSWNPNPEINIAGYILHYGTESGNLTTFIDVGNKTTHTLQGLPIGVRHYAALQAYNTLGNSSDMSAELSFVPRVKPPTIVKNQYGISQSDAGGTLDFGVVRLGAISETRSFTITNTGTTALTGLNFHIDGATAAHYLVTGMPVTKLLTGNGSFEHGFDKWTSSGNLITSNIGSATNGFRVAQFGDANRPNNGVLSQTFATSPGVSYQLNYDAGVYSFNTNPQKLRTTIRGQATLLSNDITLRGTGNGDKTWTPRTLSFTADSTSTTVTFADVSSTTNNVDLLVDHVRVINPAAAPVASGPHITTLPPGGSASFTVTYRPMSGGEHATMLNLFANEVPIALYGVKLDGISSVTLDTWLEENGMQDLPGGIPDAGGLTSLQKYAFGMAADRPRFGTVSTDSGKVNAHGTPSIRILPPADGGFQGLFARRRDHAEAKLRYKPQFSANLIQWVDATDVQTPIGNDLEMELIAVSAPSMINGKPARFFRVGVSQGSPPTFTEWLAENGITSGNHGNPDGDALINLHEFAFGTDPKTAGNSSVAETGGLIASLGAPSIRITHSPGPQLLGMFARRKQPAAAGIVYRPQFSADLTTWIDSSAVPVKLADDGEMEVVTVAAPQSINGKPARFFRVGVESISQAMTMNAWMGEAQSYDAPSSPPPDMLLKYAFGLPADSNGPPSVVAESNGELVSRGYPAGRVGTLPDVSFKGLFSRRIGHEALGLSYRPQFSADLMTWQDADANPVVLADDNEIEVVSVTAPALIHGKPARFFRVGVDYKP